MPHEKMIQFIANRFNGIDYDDQLLNKDSDGDEIDGIRGEIREPGEEFNGVEPTTEIGCFGSVTIFVRPDTPADDAIRILRKIASIMEREGFPKRGEGYTTYTTAPANPLRCGCATFPNLTLQKPGLHPAREGRSAQGPGSMARASVHRGRASGLRS